MTEPIKEPITELGQMVVGEATDHRPKTSKRIEKYSDRSALNAIGILVILATALHFSMRSGNLFLKELTIACSIIGSVVIIKNIGNPRHEHNKSDL